MDHDHHHRQAELYRAKNEIVAGEIQNLMKCLENLNVKGNTDMQLNVWCLIFSRLLEPDGKRLLCMEENIRINTKQRAHEALVYTKHPIEDFAKRINNFLYRFEHFGIAPDDIIFDEQL